MEKPKNVIDLVRLAYWVRKEAINLMMDNGNADEELLVVYCDFLYGLGQLIEYITVKIAAICGEAIAKETIWKCPDGMGPND
jgi:hypothetical protein